MPNTSVGFTVTNTLVELPGGFTVDKTVVDPDAVVDPEHGVRRNVQL